MPGHNSDRETTVVCHLRAPLLLEPLDRQVKTLNACEREGQIDSLLLRSWPKEVAYSPDSPFQEVLELVDRFDAWASERGVDIRPPFRERETTSQVTGTKRTLLVTPLLCLEVYEGEQLVGVFPHSAGDETITADDAIATLRTGRVPTPLGSPQTPAVDPAQCPDCAGSLIDGQGMYYCEACSWVGTLAADGQLRTTQERVLSPLK